MCHYSLLAVVVTFVLVAGSKASENGVKCFKCTNETRCPHVKTIFDHFQDDIVFSRDTNQPLPSCSEDLLTHTKRACVMCHNGSEHFISCFSVTKIDVEDQQHLPDVSEISCDLLETMIKGPYGSSDRASPTASSAQSSAHLLVVMCVYVTLWVTC
ncbi:hypothetical protein NL108_013219 [Boleophthalmus pectinirostris]|nr:hypothetical protein NL108_013219 [Boleophthalmus pectinirostris]